MSHEYQNIKNENIEISKIILESFYRYNQEKVQKNNDLEIKELFKNVSNKECITENISTKNAILEHKEKNFIQKLLDKIKYFFVRK